MLCTLGDRRPEDAWMTTHCMRMGLLDLWERGGGKGTAEFCVQFLSNSAGESRGGLSPPSEANRYSAAVARRGDVKVRDMRYCSPSKTWCDETGQRSGGAEGVKYIHDAACHSRAAINLPSLQSPRGWGVDAVCRKKAKLVEHPHLGVFHERFISPEDESWALPLPS